MPLYSQLEGTGSSVAGMVSRILPRGTLYLFRNGVSNVTGCRLLVVRYQQIEVDPSSVPLAPHQKLTVISYGSDLI
ncbi:hypothetical protein Tco_0771920 [Tanacetum coccineum]|uniref:Uncharacterized protein n=1 Tax=Tanacetum coccineum TaxID=301880 RepID=A0ABQ4ZGG8_9ASTR